MTDRKNAIIRTIETRLALAENREQHEIWITNDVMREILDLLKEQESVVRCKDCKNSESWYGDRCRCFLWYESGIVTFNDGFCNYGVRKDGE